MNRITAAYDLDDDHKRLWLNADLETMPDIVIVKNIREGIERTVTFVPETENAKLRELVADLWEFGYSENAGANSIKEWHRRHDELRDRVFELLEVDA